MPTGIEWCDETFNPWWGCERVSPACAHCYADTLAHRFGFYPINGEGGLWGAGHKFRFFGDKHWAEPLKWARLLPAKLGRRPRVFCASMADVFEERDELEEHRRRLFNLILQTPELDWLVLTKRPEFARDWLTVESGFGFSEHNNLWMGVSIENARYTWRADVLREIPAAVRFISAEPLLGSLFVGGGTRGASGEPHFASESGTGLAAATAAGPSRDAEGQARTRASLDLTGVDWVIAGGESGPQARPSHPDWFREIRDACIQYRGEARVNGELVYRTAPAFFFKQWGEWAPGDNEDVRSGEFHGAGDWIADCMCSEGTERLVRTGKKTNGRLMDGRTWDEFPASVAVSA